MFIIIIALFAFMKHQRIQNHLSRSAHLQMSQFKNIFTNFSCNQNIPQKYKISSDAQKSSGQVSKREKMCSALIDTGSKLYKKVARTFNDLFFSLLPKKPSFLHNQVVSF